MRIVLTLFIYPQLDLLNKILKIVTTGPESSGKSTIAKALSTYYLEPLVLEFAREYLNTFGPEYSFTELGIMARGQVDNEILLGRLSKKLLLCDTDVLNFKVWSEYKFGKVNSFILDQIQILKGQPRIYLLCSPDMKWEPDPLRENPNSREELFDMHLSVLKEYNLNYIILEGKHDARLEKAISAINGFLENLIS